MRARKLRSGLNLQGALKQQGMSKWASNKGWV